MKHSLKLIAATLALSLPLYGCATRGANYVPLVDTQGKSQSILDNDIRECQQFAQQRAGAAETAVAGAIVGGVLMALLMPRGYRNESARSGMILGAAAGGVQGNETQEVIIKRCLAGRGYNVLN